MKAFSIIFLALAVVTSMHIPTLGQAGRSGRGGNSFKNSSYHSTPRATPAKSPVSTSSVRSTAPRSFSSLAGKSSVNTSTHTSNRAIKQATNHFQTNASRVTTNPGMSYARQQQAYVESSGLARLHKFGSESNRLNAVGEGHTLYLPNKGSPKANWKANSSAIRQEIATGRPIMDSHTQPSGQLIKTGGFLNAERSLLKAKGYKYNERSKTWARTTN